VPCKDRVNFMKENQSHAS